MKLIDDIINELVDLEKPLSNALLKTKVLASQINNINLATWIDGELNGFFDPKVLPSYRKVQGEIKGTYTIGTTKYSNVQISLSHLDDEIYNSIKSIYIMDSVAALEVLIKNNSLKGISINAETKEYIEKSIINLGNHYYQLISIYKVPSQTFITNILITVRSKLLEFLLAIQKNFGLQPNIETLKISSNLITNIMNTTINNNGDGNLINTGENSIIKAKIEIKKANKQDLIDTLRANYVNQEDIDDLVKIVDVESPINNKFGTAVNSWMHKMIGKSIDGSWQIGINAAGNILAVILQNYYGLK